VLAEIGHSQNQKHVTKQMAAQERLFVSQVLLLHQRQGQEIIIMRSRFVISAIMMASFALPGTFSYAQTSRDGTVGGPAARQDAGDPLIRKPTSEEAAKNSATGVTTGESTRNISGNSGPRPKEPAAGGPASSQQSPGSNGG